MKISKNLWKAFIGALGLMFVFCSNCGGVVLGVPWISANDSKLCEESAGNINLQWSTYSSASGYTCLPTANDWLAVSPKTVSYIMSATVLDSAYVPFQGIFKLRLYICKATSSGSCNPSKSIAYYDSGNTPALSSSVSIGDQSANFGKVSTTKLDYSFNACLTMVDVEHGTEWISKAEGKDALLFCSEGAHILPDTPAKCIFNWGDDLNINFGTVERGEILTSAQKGAPGNISRTIPVVCGGDASVATKVSVEFTPVVIQNNQVISTSTEGLGVLVYINGVLMEPSSHIDINFEPGESKLDIELQAIRDASEKLATGDFNASAVLVAQVV